MHKTRIDFQVQAYLLRPPKWVIHRCSMCNYPCGYVFDETYECVGYDSGCYCTNRNAITFCSWDALAKYYNLQTNEKYIEEMNVFWGFKNV